MSVSASDPLLLALSELQSWPQARRTPASQRTETNPGALANLLAAAQTRQFACGADRTEPCGPATTQNAELHQWRATPSKPQRRSPLPYRRLGKTRSDAAY